MDSGYPPGSQTSTRAYTPLVFNRSSSKPLSSEELAGEMETVLQKHVLDAWFPVCVDNEDGGFLQSFDRAWRRFDDAGQRFLRTIDVDPTVEQPYAFLARMIDQLESWWPAIEPAFTRWNERETRSHLPPFVLARLLRARGGAEDRAEQLLRTSIARKADFAESHFELGGVLEQKRQWAAAATEYETSARLNPKLADAHYRLARVYARLQQPEKAAQARARHEQLSAATPAAGMAERR